jgi:hypothetical protein
MMKLLWIVIITSTLVVSARESVEKMTVYYVPFQVETYEPITTATIKDRAKYRLDVADANEILSLLRMLSNAKGESSFDQKRVRLLVVAEKREIVVDADGNVLDAGKTYRLSREQFGQLKTVMSRLIGGR